MSIKIAFKAFMKAWKNPSLGEKFLSVEKLIDKENKDLSHLKLLSLLQESARLIDFFKEDISSYSDAEVGLAVRKIHETSSKCLEELVTIRPLFHESEGSKIQVAKDYDTTSIKLVGKVKGDGPYQGTVVHRGWKAHKRSLPKKLIESNDTLQAAVIEIL